MLKIHKKGVVYMQITSKEIPAKVKTDADGVVIFITEASEHDIGWRKVTIEPFFDIISKLTKSQMNVFKYIMLIIGERNNVAHCNAELLGNCCKNVSSYTINETLRILEKNEFMRKMDSKKYMINPLILYYGADNKKLIKQYAALSSNKLPEYENKKWLKIWIINFMETLENDTGKGPEIWFTGKSLRVVKCLLENMYDGNNTVKLTQRQIAAKSELGLELVNQTLKKLKAQDLISYKPDEEGIRINPVCFAGVSGERRAKICTAYQRFVDSP